VNDDELVRAATSAPLSVVYDVWCRIDHHPYGSLSDWYKHLQQRNVHALEVAERMLPLIVEARLKQ
jgi:hypothetical protein